MNEKSTTTRSQLGTDFREGHGEESKPPTFALATKRCRAIDLSCRACDACYAGAGCWDWIPGGGLRSAPFSTPNLQLSHCLSPVNVRTQAFLHVSLVISSC